MRNSLRRRLPRALLRCLATAGTAAVCGVCAGNVDAQTTPVEPLPYTGVLRVTGSAAGGTQQQNSFGTTDFFAYHRGHNDPAVVKAETRLQAEFSYGNAKKPGQSRVTSTEMAYLEALQSVALVSLRGDTTASHLKDWQPQSWIYGVASVYHHIAFGLDREQSYGVGLKRSLNSGWSFSADIRHIQQTFDGPADFTSWGLGLRESYSVSRFLGTAPNVRVVSFSESLEVVPAFASEDAVKARGIAAVSLPIVNRFSWDLSFGTDYLGNAAPGSKKWYWKATLVGLSYAFGAP